MQIWNKQYLLSRISGVLVTDDNLMVAGILACITTLQQFLKAVVRKGLVEV